MQSATPPERQPLQEFLGVLMRANLDASVPSLLDAVWLALQPGFNLNDLAPAPRPGPLSPPAMPPAPSLENRNGIPAWPATSRIAGTAQTPPASIRRRRPQTK